MKRNKHKSAPPDMAETSMTSGTSFGQTAGLTIDEQIAQMADDPEYQELMERIDEGFAASDWEAWQIAELPDTH